MNITGALTDWLGIGLQTQVSEFDSRARLDGDCHSHNTTTGEKLETTTTRQVRPYGVEIETPEVAQVFSTLEDAGFTFAQDSSVTYPDCYCSCDDCDHSCGCDRCDIANGYEEPDHCTQCRSNETQTPIQYEAKLTPTVREALAELHSENTEDGENGGHIHINAPEVTAKQAGIIQTIWHKIPELMPDLVGRDWNTYANDNRPKDGEQYNENRFSAVNVCNLAEYWNAEGVNDRPHQGKFDTRRQWTIEFRQFAGTASPDLIERRAQVCRALVDYIAEGGAPYWVLRAKTAKELAEVLDLANH